MHNVTYLDYRTLDYSAKGLPAELTEPENSEENGVARLHHLAAICFLLRNIHFAVEPNTEDLNAHLRDVGDLGDKITRGLFGDLEILAEAAQTSNLKTGVKDEPTIS